MANDTPVPDAAATSFIASIISDPKTVPDVQLLYGYIGASSEENSERLYLSLDLSNYVEIPNAAILHRAPATTQQDPYGGVTVWVKKDAALSYKMAPAAQALAHYFAGAIQAGARPVTPGPVAMDAAARPLPLSPVCHTQVCTVPEAGACGLATRVGCLSVPPQVCWPGRITAVPGCETTAMAPCGTTFGGECGLTLPDQVGVAAQPYVANNAYRTATCTQPAGGCHHGPYPMAATYGCAAPTVAGYCGGAQVAGGAEAAAIQVIPTRNQPACAYPTEICTVTPGCRHLSAQCPNTGNYPCQQSVVGYCGGAPMEAMAAAQPAAAPRVGYATGGCGYTANGFTGCPPQLIPTQHQFCTTACQW